MTSIDELQNIKNRLGPVVFLDFTHLNLIEGHRALGEEVKDQVLRWLHFRLNHLEEAALERKVIQGRRCAQRLARLADDSQINPAIRLALEEYLACLNAWAEGAQITGFEHPRLSNPIDGSVLTAQDLALLLQHDNTGCQTGVLRQNDGSVTLWHAEEDVDREAGCRFDRLRVAVFRIDDDGNPVEVSAFIYPDLLPGAAFAWRSDHFVQATDTLLLGAHPVMSDGCLVNVASWTALRLGKSVEILELLHTLRPFYDGYALNVAFRDGDAQNAQKIEFAGDWLIPYSLSSDVGSYLFQVNVFCNRRSRMLRSIEDLSDSSREYFNTRLARTRRSLHRNKMKATTGDLSFFHRLLSNRAGGEGAYANVDVKAFFLAHLRSAGTELWLGGGPASSGEEPIILHV